MRLSTQTQKGHVQDKTERRQRSASGFVAAFGPMNVNSFLHVFVGCTGLQEPRETKAVTKTGRFHCNVGCDGSGSRGVAVI